MYTDILTTITLFSLLTIFLIIGVPIAFALGGVGIILILWKIGPDFLYVLATTTFKSWTDFLLISCPLFILMGNLLESSGIAEDLYDMIYKWFGHIKGGLASGTILICAIFAAMAGISGVATITMGLIALPSMLNRGYNKILAVGVITAGGTLGILIPPSIIMIIYASLTGDSVGKLFMGGFLPGILMAILFIIYIQIRSFLQKNIAPPISVEERVSFREKLISLKNIIFPGFLILIVLGVIYTGICTPTEASGIGATGAFICTIIKKRLNWKILIESLIRTLKTTSMLMWIIIGAKTFTHAYHAIGSPNLILDIISELEFNKWLIIIIMQIILMILGCFIDPVGIILICTPVFIPIIERFNFSTIWFGILFTINMELAYITPPFGFNLFYMKNICPKEITMKDIYISIIPFVFIIIVGLSLIIIFPQIAMWLPNKMIK